MIIHTPPDYQKAQTSKYYKRWSNYNIRELSLQNQNPKTKDFHVKILICYFQEHINDILKTKLPLNLMIKIWILQKLNRILRRKPRQRGLCGTPLLAAAREPERQAAEPYICGTMLLRVTAENHEQDIAARKVEKAANEDR